MSLSRFVLKFQKPQPHFQQSGFRFVGSFADAPFCFGAIGAAEPWWLSSTPSARRSCEVVLARPGLDRRARALTLCRRSLSWAVFDRVMVSDESQWGLTVTKANLNCKPVRRFNLFGLCGCPNAQQAGEEEERSDVIATHWMGCGICNTRRCGVK